MNLTIFYWSKIGEKSCDTVPLNQPFLRVPFFLYTPLAFDENKHKEHHIFTLILGAQSSKNHPTHLENVPNCPRWQKKGHAVSGPSPGALFKNIPLI